MRSITFLIMVFLLLGSTMFAQVGINDDNSEPDPAAGLDVKFTNKGFLPPRVTCIERNDIPGAPAGLMVWCTDCGTKGELQVFNGTNWTNMIGGAASAPFSIGMTYGGGVIFYVDITGVHGLISATTDQSAGVEWGCFLTSIPGTSAAIGAGQDNTLIIINGCSDAGIAARICDDLVLNEYSDWFLPSQDELNQMYLQRNVIGGFTNGSYWSSSEFSYVRAIAQNFVDGSQNTNQKTNTFNVRAIRAF